MVSLTYQLVDKNAVAPKQAYDTDTGYDLTIIKEHKVINQTVIMYDTGVRIKVDPGYYVEIVPRSSIIKSGYMLANSIGIIDESYRGNLYVALAKIDPAADPITLPFKGFQLIIRERVKVNVVEGIVDEKETERGTGGFGSTNKQ